jgi:predicted alpha/beta-hydrolase family hydrolase
LRGVEIMTSEGPARAEIDYPAAAPGSSPAARRTRPGNERPAFLFVLTHGAGGGAETPDLRAAGDAALRMGGVVVRVTQPYRVKGRRAPGPAARQDAAWVEIVMALRDATWAVTGEARPDVPLIQGGRSNGARVACRTARAVGARAVVALAFPLHPPGRPGQSRAMELRETGTDVLVVNGDRDPFGIPDRADATRVVVLAGESHALSRRPEAVADAVGSWLSDVLATGAAARRPR